MKQYTDIIRNMHKVVGRRKRLDYLLFGSCAAYNLAGLLPPLATAGIIKVITDGLFSDIWLYAGLYVVFYAVYFLFLRVNHFAYMKMAEFYHISLQRRIFASISEHPELLNKVPRGRIIDTYADDVRWMVDAANVATEIILQLFRLLIIFVIFLTIDFNTGVIAVLVDVLYLLILNGNAKEEAKRYGNARKQEDKSLSAFAEMVNVKDNAIRDKKDSKSNEHLMAAEAIKEQEERMEKSFVPWRREYRKRRKTIANRCTFWAAIPFLGKIVLYILLAKAVMDGIMGLDVLVLLIGYFEMTITCMDKLTSYLLDLSNYGVRIDRLKQVL